MVEVAPGACGGNPYSREDGRSLQTSIQRQDEVGLYPTLSERVDGVLELDWSVEWVLENLIPARPTLNEQGVSFARVVPVRHQALRRFSFRPRTVQGFPERQPPSPWRSSPRADSLRARGLPFCPGRRYHSTASGQTLQSYRTWACSPPA